MQQHPQIDQYIGNIEKNILEAKQLLEQGHEASLQLLRNHISNATRVHRKLAAREIDDAITSENEALQDIEKCIGEMDFLNAHHKIEDMACFDELFDHLSTALSHARARTGIVSRSSEGHLAEFEPELRTAWENLHRTLEVVRLEIAMASNKLYEDTPELRHQLTEVFRKAAQAKEDKERKDLLYSARQFFDDEANIIKDSLVKFLSEHPELSKWIKNNR